MKNISLLSILTIIFVIAKIWGKIDWSWWLVTLPTWGGLVLALIIAVSVVAIDSLYNNK